MPNACTSNSTQPVRRVQYQVCDRTTSSKSKSVRPPAGIYPRSDLASYYSGVAQCFLHHVVEEVDHMFSLAAHIVIGDETALVIGA